MEENNIQFYISIDEFKFQEQSINKNNPNIERNLGGATIIFTNEAETFSFDTKEISIEEFRFELPVGIYDIKIESPTSLYGQSTPSFNSTLINIEISDLTDTIKAKAKPTCALLMVKDEFNQLEDGAYIIESNSLKNDDFIAYPMAYDSLSNLYFTYIFPDTTLELPNAYLWFYSNEIEKENGGIHTEIFEMGYKYLIEVLE